MVQETQKLEGNASKAPIKLMSFGAMMGAVVGGVLLVEASKSCAIDPAAAKLVWIKTLGVAMLMGAAFGVCVHKMTGKWADKPVIKSSDASEDAVVFAL